MFVRGSWTIVLVVILLPFACALEQESSATQHERDDSTRSLFSRCRRDPTWRSVDYAACQELMEWKPRDRWWRTDTEMNAIVLAGNEQNITNCLDEAMENAKKLYPWASIICDDNVNQNDEACIVEPPHLVSHYFRMEEGEITVFENALSEQEAFALEALERCTREIFDHKMPFYQVRGFGEDINDVYNVEGGNYCSFLNGLLQMYLPGVAATLTGIIQYAYHELDWGEDHDFPSPDSLGIRTAEFLRYKKTGNLGLHEDDGSVYSISVALSDPSDYQGGYFQLPSGEALFKVPRRSAIVFFSESTHGITQILEGDRKVFVAEFWDEEDTPVGLPRSDEEAFLDHKELRSKGMEGLILGVESE